MSVLISLLTHLHSFAFSISAFQCSIDSVLELVEDGRLILLFISWFFIETGRSLTTLYPFCIWQYKVQIKQKIKLNLKMYSLIS